MQRLENERVERVIFARLAEAVEPAVLQLRVLAESVGVKAERVSRERFQTRPADAAWGVLEVFVDYGLRHAERLENLCPTVT